MHVVLQGGWHGEVYHLGDRAGLSGSRRLWTAALGRGAYRFDSIDVQTSGSYICCHQNIDLLILKAPANKDMSSCAAAKGKTVVVRVLSPNEGSRTAAEAPRGSPEAVPPWSRTTRVACSQLTRSRKDRLKAALAAYLRFSSLWFWLSSPCNSPTFSPISPSKMCSL